MTITITMNEKATPVGQLAEAALQFDETDGLLAGLKLIGFAIWERRGGSGKNVTMPSRQYAINGERRSFAVLRPIADTAAQTPLREAILAAYEAAVEAAETASSTV